MSKKNSKARRARIHAHAAAKEVADDADRKRKNERKAGNRVRRMSSIMASGTDLEQMMAAAAAVPEIVGSDGSLMPPPAARAAASDAVHAAAADATAAAAAAGPRRMKKPVKRSTLSAPGANLLLATFAAGSAMETEDDAPPQRQRKMSKSFEVALRYDSKQILRGPSKSITKRAKGPKAIAAITGRLQRAAAKRAAAMETME